MVRKRGQLKTKALWIFCEGEKTEKNYFLKLKIEKRIRRLNLRINTSGPTDALGLINHAISFAKKDNRFIDGDLIYCIFDRDNNSNSQLTKAMGLALAKGISIIFSNPCFEFWILCHYRYHPTRCEVSDLKTSLNRYFNNDYKKNDPEIYTKTKDNTSIAKRNAIRVNKSHIDKDIEIISRDSNPLTLVYELIDLIDNFKD